jgi:hypothetical protein
MDRLFAPDSRPTKSGSGADHFRSAPANLLLTRAFAGRGDRI